MTAIRGLSGQLICFRNPRSDQFRISDIAHGLAKECRYSNQIEPHYSVAEHSVRVSYMVPKELALWGLLHDLSEAYMRDIPKPLKEMLPNYHLIENRVMKRGLEAFRLFGPMPTEVKLADHRIYAFEVWELNRSAERADYDAPGSPPPAVFAEAEAAKAMFFKRFYELV